MSDAEPGVHRTCTPVVDGRFDPVDGPTLPRAIVDALASAADVGATELPPLYGTVDLDAMKQLFPTTDGSGDAERLFSFTYDTWQVFVRGDGRIRVCDQTQPTPPTPVFEGTPLQ